jgi:hypothetical protein
MKKIDVKKPLKSFNIFQLGKALEGITMEKPISVNYTRDGDLVILAKNELQASKYLNAKTLTGVCNIEAIFHPTLNTNKGIIYSPHLSALTEKEIVDGLKDQHVIECKKITKMEEGKIVCTPLHILSFDLYEIPQHITLSFLRVKVEPYIPTPMQCKNCFILGHTRNKCKADNKCFVFSRSEHNDLCIKVECINCKSEHRSNNKMCPTYQKRQQIIKHKTINKCSYQDAVSAVNGDKKIIFKEVTEKLSQALELKKKVKSNIKSTAVVNDQKNT